MSTSFNETAPFPYDGETIPVFARWFGSWRVSIQRMPFSGSELRARYDQAAPKWDRTLNRRGQPDEYETILREALPPQRLKAFEPTPRVLDCGVGTGALSRALADVWPAPFELDGIDISPRMIERARRNLREASVEATLRQGDVRRLPYPNGTFDLVMTAHVLEHLVDPSAALNEIARVLKPGGLLIACLTRRSAFGMMVHLKWRTHRVTSEQAERWLIESGLDHVRRLPSPADAPQKRISLVCVGRKPKSATLQESVREREGRSAERSPASAAQGLDEGTAMTSMPNTMTAVVQHTYGLESFEIRECPVPSAGPGQIRIKVAASAINPMNWHLATGSPGIVRLVEGFRRPKHAIPGREACGVVDQVGPSVTDFEIGQTVFGWMTGAFAEYAIAQTDRIWLAPTKMTNSECAGLPVAGAAALEAIERGDVAGKRVLVNGASGGVGHYAVQIARARGAHWVAGVCSTRNADFVRDLGADQVIEYDSEDFTADRWDVIVDCVGNRTDAEIRGALVDNGRWIVVGDHHMGGLLGPFPRLVVRLMRWRFGSQSCHWFIQGEDVRYLEELAALVDEGRVRSHLSKTISMSDVRAGYDRIESGRTVGKLVVNVATEHDAESIEASNKVGAPS